MFRRVDDFLKSWQYESGATLRIFRALTDSSLDQKVTSDGRSLGFLAWHITTTMSEMLPLAGLPVHVTKHTDPAPAKAAEITEAYGKSAQAVAEAVRSQWSDARLADEIPMYGETWTKSFVLGALIAHQCHHRGQMTVLMRQAGLAVPGVYGPAREEWAAAGMEAQP